MDTEEAFKYGKMLPTPILYRRKMDACRLYFSKECSRKEAQARTNLTDNQMKKAVQKWRRGRLTGFYTDKRGAHKKKRMILDKQNIKWFAEYGGQNPSKGLDELRSQFC